MTLRLSASVLASRSLKLTVAFLLIATLSLPARAAEKELRIATVDIEKILSQLDSRQEAMAKFERDQRAAEQAMEKMRAEIENTAKELEFFREGSPEYNERAQKIAAMQQQFNRQADRFRTQLQETARAELQNSLKQVYDFVKTYAATEGYDLVVDSRAVIYAAGGKDISVDIARTMNKQYKDMLPKRDEKPVETK